MADIAEMTPDTGAADVYRLGEVATVPLRDSHVDSSAFLLFCVVTMTEMSKLATYLHQGFGAAAISRCATDARTCAASEGDRTKQQN